MEEDESINSQKKERRKRKPKCFEPESLVDGEEALEGEKKKRRGRKKKNVEPEPESKEEITDFQQIHKVVEQLISSSGSAPFMEQPDATQNGMADYYEIITRPMWFNEVMRKYKSAEYKTPKEIAADVRQMLENCYQYWGPNDTLSKKALKLEQMFENKLSTLPESVQVQCSLVATHGEIIKGEPDESLVKRNNVKKGYVSKLMNWVCSGNSAKKSEEGTELTGNEHLAEREAAEKQLTLWESNNLLTNGVKEQIVSMWEFPVIGQFLCMVYNVLNIEPISHLELELMLLMPQASKTLATLLTSMLIPPLFRAKLEVGPAMPYSIWTRRLYTKVASWYRLFRSKGDSTIEVFDLLGIEPQFWLIMGEENPLKDYQFHELTFLQRVWLLKALCDFLLHNHKTIQECINNLEMKELRSKNLGRDKQGYSYHYFPMFPEVRIYKMARVPDAKANTIQLKIRKTCWKNYEAGVEEAIAMCAEEEDEDDPNQEPNLLGLTRRPLHKPPRSMRPSHSDFRLVCESLEDVRILLAGLCDSDEASEGVRRLIASLRGILRDLEGKEAKLNLAAFKVRNRMRDEWNHSQNKSADYVDPGLVYWERKEKEEKKASEDKLMELSLPSTSSDITPSADKRERRTRRESTLKILSREDNGDDSEEESPLDFDDDSEDEWFATKKDKEIKKKKRCMSVKKLKKLSDISDKMAHSMSVKEKANSNSNSMNGTPNNSGKGCTPSELPVTIKEEIVDFDEKTKIVPKPHLEAPTQKSHHLGKSNHANSSTNKQSVPAPMVCKQEILDEPPGTKAEAPVNNMTSVIQRLVPVKVEKLTEPTPDLSKLKRSNSPDDVVYISDSEDPTDVKPNPTILAQQLKAKPMETINYSMGVLQQPVGSYLMTGVPVGVNPQPQMFNMAQQQPTQNVTYQMQTPQLVQQPVIRPNPTLVGMQSSTRGGTNQKFVVIQPNTDSVNQPNQFANKNSQPQNNNFPTTPTVQSVNWFGSRGSPNYSPRQRAQSMVIGPGHTTRGRGSPRTPMTPPRGGPRFSGRTPPNNVRSPGSVIRTSPQMGIGTPARGIGSPARGRGAATMQARPSPIRNLNFNRSPVKTPNNVLPRVNSPDIEGTLVVSMTESGAFGYVVMLPDGGKISLTQDQLSKIRSDNGGTLPKTCKVPWNMQTEGFQID